MKVVWLAVWLAGLWDNLLGVLLALTKVGKRVDRMAVEMVES